MRFLDQSRAFDGNVKCRDKGRSRESPLKTRHDHQGHRFPAIPIRRSIFHRCLILDQSRLRRGRLRGVVYM